MVRPNPSDKGSSRKELIARVRAKVNGLLAELLKKVEDDLRNLPEDDIELLGEFDLNAFRFSLFSQPLNIKYDLTDKEMKVAELAAIGYQAKEIAEKFKNKINTVYTHIRSIYKELKVHNRVELARKLLVLYRPIKE